MNTVKKIMLGASIACLGLKQASAIELLSVEKDGVETKVSLSGYAKIDIRHVEGDITYQDYWVANYPGGRPVDTSNTGFNVKESRLNVKMQHGDVTGVVEMDFYGVGGNEVVSNSSNPRLRHYYITHYFAETQKPVTFLFVMKKNLQRLTCNDLQLPVQQFAIKHSTTIHWVTY